MLGSAPACTSATSSLHFFPLRGFALERLREGEVAFWNPYVHEGAPLSLPALGYPLDLVGVAWPDEAFLSLLLALHVPMGAFFFWVLARGLGLRTQAASGGALVYALGGFFLSTINLYVYVQAAAWAPLVVLTLIRLLDEGGRRAIALAALALAVTLSTTGMEIAAQAVAAGLVLGLRARRGRPRPAASPWRWRSPWRSPPRCWCCSPDRWPAARAGAAFRRRSCSHTPFIPSLSSRPWSAASSAISRTSRTSGGARTSSRAGSPTC